MRIVSDLSAPGIYILVINVSKRICLDIESLNRPCIDSGLYGYVGSARGPGGIRARLEHHLRRDKKRLWWHIDYLTTKQEVVPLLTIYVNTLDDVERIFAETLIDIGCWQVAVPRFGSTDKKTPSHLLKCVCSETQCIEHVLKSFELLGLQPAILQISSTVHVGHIK